MDIEFAMPVLVVYLIAAGVVWLGNWAGIEGHMLASDYVKLTLYSLVCPLFLLALICL